MPILAIDTSTMVSSVAVGDKKKLAAELTVQTRLTHSETLMPHIQQVMEMAGIRREELDAVAVNIGPGSFTGLRIGLGAAKAMAYALDIPLIGVPAMVVLAWQTQAPGIRLVPLIDAQKGNVYTASYIWEPAAENGQTALKLTCQEAINVKALQEVLDQLAADGGLAMVSGDMAAKKAAMLAEQGRLPENIILAEAQAMMPRAACVAIAAAHRLEAGDYEMSAVMDMEPIYIRRSEAEELWEKRQAKLAAEAGEQAEL